MRTVLLADRDPDTRRILRDYLAVSDLRVEPCDTPAEVEDRLRVGSPAAVIVEPYGLGPEAVGLVRGLRTGALGAAPLPVLVYTALTEPSLLRPMAELGAGIVTKPARPDRVLRSLQELFARQSPDVPPSPPGGGAYPPLGP